MRPHPDPPTLMDWACRPPGAQASTSTSSPTAATPLARAAVDIVRGYIKVCLTRELSWLDPCMQGLYSYGAAYSSAVHQCRTRFEPGAGLPPIGVREQRPALLHHDHVSVIAFVRCSRLFPGTRVTPKVNCSRCLLMHTR
jgi:hypothetical protein